MVTLERQKSQQLKPAEDTGKRELIKVKTAGLITVPKMTQRVIEQKTLSLLRNI